MADKTRAQILGENLKRIREQKGVTRKQLAEATGIATNAIGEYETGRNLPPLDKIFSIADSLDVAITDITGENKKAVDKKVFEYRFARAKKMLEYLFPMASSLGDEALTIDDDGHVTITSAEKITYKNGVVTTYGELNAVTFRNVEIFVDVMERAEYSALFRQIPFNQAFNELVDESKKE